jgi:hypothetical protein
VYQRLITKKIYFIPENGAHRQERVISMIFSKFLRHSAESLKRAVFGAGE